MTTKPKTRRLAAVSQGATRRTVFFTPGNDAFSPIKAHPEGSHGIEHVTDMLYDIIATSGADHILRSHATGGYIAANADGSLNMKEPDAGKASSFTVEYISGERARFLLPALRSCITMDESSRQLFQRRVGRSAPPSFPLVPLFGALHLPEEEMPHSCGGPGKIKSPNPVKASHREDEPLPAWDDLGHWQAIRFAANLMPQTDIGKRFIALWNRGDSVFAKNVFRGLHECDYVTPYTGTGRGKYALYECHFYDPDTGKNYLYTDGTAASWGAQLADSSISRMNASSPDLAKAGYELGLALHFLTDLTQPMHAANFANAYGNSWPVWERFPARPLNIDWRHSGFETAAEKFIAKGYLRQTAITPDDINIDSNTSFRQYYNETAKASKNVFIHKVKQVLEQKVIEKPSPIIPFVNVFFVNVWSEEETLPILDASLKRAPHCVARFLALWTSKLAAPH